MSGSRIVLLLLTIVLLGVLSMRVGGDDETRRGRTLFLQNCALCHAAGPVPGGGEGPNLSGVVGRAAASAPSYAYSAALKQAQLRWDKATLDRFLAAPATLVPGTTMPIATADPAQRQALIAFLATTSASAASRIGDDGAAGRLRAGDWRNDAPGRAHRIVVADLPAPYATPSARNGASKMRRPDGVLPQVPPGFAVTEWAGHLDGPRLLSVAPNGDVFVAETARGRIVVLRGADGGGRAARKEVFASGLDRPFGIAFHPLDGEPQWVYVANNNSVVRFAYRNADLTARSEPEIVVARLSESTGGHSTRGLQFSADGERLYISVGSGSNVAEGLPAKSLAARKAWDDAQGLGAAWGDETGRAAVLVTDPLGRTPLHSFANGIRNCVGMTLQPATGALWCATNERDGLGDDLVPDYVTTVREGAFYGWPWYYFGDHEDPRHKGARPELAGHVTVPDVPLQAHSAAVGIAFYDASAGVARFPVEYRGDAFVALHGSWNRSQRTGYKLVRVPMKDGLPVGGYEDFMTGFIGADDKVWGRPVGVVTAHDGALLVSDDVGGRIWRIAPLPTPD